MKDDLKAAGTFLETIYLGSPDKEFLEGYRSHIDHARVRRVLDTYRGILDKTPPAELEARRSMPKELLEEMGKAGFFGLSIPEEYGGLGFNLWEYLEAVRRMVMIDMASALPSLAHLSIGTKGLLLFGTEALKRKYLVPAASGEMIFAYALTEPRIGSDAQNIETRAQLSEDGTSYILNGHKTYVTNANYAGAMTVFAQMDPTHPGHLGAFVVESKWDGVTVGKDMPKMGLKASSTAPVHFRDVRVPVENLLGKPGDGFRIAMTILNYGRLALGAASVGMMDQSLDDMLKRSASRVQFGVPIRKFPLIQEKIVKARVHSFTASCINSFLAGMLEKDPLANPAMETSHCKLYGTTQAWETLYDALQVAGGAGYLSTLPYEKRMRDFRVATVFEGTTEIHSIYPPVFLVRKMAKLAKEKGRGRLATMVFMMKSLLGGKPWHMEVKNIWLKRALRVCRSNMRRVRWLLFWGTLLHGKTLLKKEYLLRRITHLSLHAFGILSVMSRLASEEKRGSLDMSD
ncbi:MAG: hypothetical protein HGA84_06410, partial [Syntrophobacteraceae bacterium]|nr:hypothetical protein [Syntrophobacteraceae bacterium]